jgi:hypothetical protein
MAVKPRAVQFLDDTGILIPKLFCDVRNKKLQIRHVCMYVCMYVRTHVCKYMCGMCLCACVCVRACT